MNRNRWHALALISCVIMLVPTASWAVDGVLNFDTDAESPVFMKAVALFGTQDIAGVEVYENDRTASARSVELVAAGEDGTPDFESVVTLTAVEHLDDGWTRYAAREAVSLSGRVWIKVAYATGRTEFAVDSGTGPAIGYTVASEPVGSPQLVSSDGGESFDRLDSRLNLAANVLLAGDVIAGSSVMLEKAPVADPLADRMISALPNPFNPRTKVSFRLDTAGQVTLRVFDIRGRLVETLVDGPRDSGRHEVVWDASGGTLASGVYFLTLDGPQGRVVQRVALVR